VERAAGVVFKLEILEAEVRAAVRAGRAMAIAVDNGVDDLRVGHSWKGKRRAGWRGVGGFVVVVVVIGYFFEALNIGNLSPGGFIEQMIAQLVEVAQAARPHKIPASQNPSPKKRKGLAEDIPVQDERRVAAGFAVGVDHAEAAFNPAIGQLLLAEAFNGEVGNLNYFVEAGPGPALEVAGYWV
jgi:hypothetical protein